MPVYATNFPSEGTESTAKFSETQVAGQNTLGNHRGGRASRPKCSRQGPCSPPRTPGNAKVKINVVSDWHPHRARAFGIVIRNIRTSR